MKKKVIIVTYYWPPSGGPGVQRWLSFVQHLPNYGVEPIVFTPKSPRYPIIDKSLLNDIPEKLKVIKRCIIEPNTLVQLFFPKRIKTISSGIIENKKTSFVEKVMLWLRGNIFIPDARAFWVAPSVRYLKKYISNNGIDTVITTGPPHSLHLIGLELSKKHKVKWIADFRDPWCSISYHKKLFFLDSTKKKHEVLEREVLNSADSIIVTSPSTQKEFQSKTTTPVHLITNGYDKKKRLKTPKCNTFNISHIGTILANRNPQALWKVLSDMVKKDEGFSKDFSLQFVGKVSAEVLSIVGKYGLMSHTKKIDYLPHQVAIGIQDSSSLLLLLEADIEETKAIIPGKLFEYMASKNPIIAIGPKDWDVEGIIEKTKTGVCFNYGEEEKLREEIQRRYRDFKEGKVSKEQVGVEEYSRKNLTSKLASIIFDL